MHLDLSELSLDFVAPVLPSLTRGQWSPGHWWHVRDVKQQPQAAPSALPLKQQAGSAKRCQLDAVN